MAKEKVRKSIELFPLRVADLSGKELVLADVEKILAEDVKELTREVKKNITAKNRDKVKKHDKDTQGFKDPATTAGRKVGIAVPVSKEEKKAARGTGASRRRMIIQGHVVEALRSWIDRSSVANKDPEKKVSAGYKRTARGSKPKNLTPKMNLGFADSQYRKVAVLDKEISLKLLIKGIWYIFYFPLPKRFDGTEKITAPTITVNEKDGLRWVFTGEWPYTYAHFSSQYVIGVDVGISNYATLVVVDVKTKEVVCSTALSQRVHSLVNKAGRTKNQISNLYKKGKSEEVVSHRESNSLRKRELAILAGKEIAEISARYGNALVVFEDLSFIKNTMKFGRWNRGELVSKTIESVYQNGGRAMKVSASYTSQKCHKCGEKVSFEKNYHIAECTNEKCGYKGDRDYNAAVNVAKRFISNGRYASAKNTRNTAKNKGNKSDKKSRGGEGKNLKYPGVFKRKKKVDRTKNAPTLKRLKQVKTDYAKEVKELKKNKNQRPAQEFTVALDANICENTENRMTITGGVINSSDSKESKAFIDCRLL